MPISLLAQSDPTVSQRLFEAVTLMVVGMAVVFAALVLLWLAIRLLDAASQKWASPSTAAPAPPRPGARTAGHDPQLIAVLTAAACAALNQPVRVTDVKQVDGESESH